MWVERFGRWKACIERTHPPRVSELMFNFVKLCRFNLILGERIFALKQSAGKAPAHTDYSSNIARSLAFAFGTGAYHLRAALAGTPGTPICQLEQKWQCNMYAKISYYFRLVLQLHLTSKRTHIFISNACIYVFSFGMRRLRPFSPARIPLPPAQDKLKKMRELDDKIIYALNVSIPTESFKHKEGTSGACGDLRNKIERNFDVRHSAITECIAVTADRVKALKTERDSTQSDTGADRSFKFEQRKVRAECSRVR